MLEIKSEKSSIRSSARATTWGQPNQFILKILFIFFILGITPTLQLFAQQRDDTWIRKRVAEIKESDNSEWRKIGWSESLREAEKSAKDEDRPVFLFTLDGNLDTGRC